MFKNKETGYTPFNGINKILSVVAFIGLFFVYDVISYGGVGAVLQYGNGKQTVFAAALGLIATVILLIRNITKCSNPVIGIIASLLGVVLSVLVIALGFILGWLGVDTSKVTNNPKYTNEEDLYAKANGYYDAAAANEQGFDTSEAKNPGFDYTQKR